ncbi:chloroplast sensor kinase, chloroplastic isoform X2 [Juglans microcarpa x Juglans regia]|uniref:chloroplast sensor kinase, chloroplastic isoform X2 n=1 Tax=Juglans microcarpa x Juglans regia TaxID=2249226 RepID=UPI001B7E97A3|nr:chloroplast sensor kinase, chloroplastic isoform X2 [Juglans microcarpa x Juglans regia]
MLLSATTPRPPLSNPNSLAFNLHFCTNISSLRSLRTYIPNHRRRPFLLFTHASSSLTNPNPHTLRHVSNHDEPEGPLVSSASAVASAIRRASTSPVEFLQRTEKDHKSRLVLPSPDFQRLCIEQLDLFRRVLDPDAQLSVYVRPAGSYVMDRLELRRATVYPGGVDVSDTVILVGTFGVPTGLRAAEAALSNQQVEVFVPENRAVVFPMVKNPFVVGFLVAELPMLEPGACEDGVSEAHDLIHYFPSPEEAYSLPPGSGIKSWEIQSVKNEPMRMYRFSAEQRANAINISRSLAMAYVMDQKAMLLQQSSWQNNVRMCDLVEQIRGPLSSIRTLGKMLSVQLKKSEISYDIVKDILVQGDHIRDTLQQLQDAVYLTKANIVHYNDETLKKVHNSTYAHESVRSQLPNNLSSDGSKNKVQKSLEPLSLNAVAKDLEMPLPPLALAPLQHGIRPCNISTVLADLIEAVRPLAHKQQRVVELSELSDPLQVAVEEPALRQALSNLIEGALLRTHVGGKVEIVSTGAPAGGSLVVIDDDGPDMHYMTQMHSLTPFGADLFSEDMVEDNMTWNFVAGIAVAREILESYGCVLRIISPRTTDAALGAGGTRVELWLPLFLESSDLNGHTQKE